MTGPDRTRVAVGEPREILALVCYSLGYRPQDSLALVGVREDRSTLVARIDLPAPWPDHVGLVAEALAGIRRDDEVDAPGTGPVAFGALPFDRSRGASLLVPHVLDGVTAEGARWTTTVTGAESGPPAADGPIPTPMSSVTVRSTRATDEWCAAVASATERIAAGALTKDGLGTKVSQDGTFEFPDIQRSDRRAA